MNNNFIELTVLTSLLLIFIPSITLTTLHIVFYFRGRKYRSSLQSSNGLNEISLTIVIPVRNEPLEYILKRLEEISNWRIKGRLDVIIVSMDPYEFYLELVKHVEKYRRDYLNIFVIWRNTIEGYKARSLNIALWFSNTKYFYLMDVDSTVDYGFIEKACRVMDNDSSIVAVVGRWCGLNRDTRIAQAVASSIDFLTETIYKGRYVSKLSVYPLGTGTVFRRDFLLKLKGWDEKRLLDDLEIGCRIINKNGKIVYLHEYVIGVEVPRKYSSLTIQQERWVYGAFDVFLSRFKHIWFSQQSLLGKIDMIMYLLQYLPSITTLIGAVVLSLASYITRFDFLSKYWFLAFIWIISLTLYSKCYVKALRSRNYSIKNSLINLGRSGVLLTIMSPIFLKSFIKKLMGIKLEFKRTPKGKYDIFISKYRFPQEFVIGFLLFIYSIFLLVNRIVYTGLWFLTYSFPYIYAAIKWRKDILTI
ncbi:MAG: glycosyltransferase family 2 protein [Desulfurococcaceae archaeon]